MGIVAEEHNVEGRRWTAPRTFRVEMQARQLGSVHSRAPDAQTVIKKWYIDTEGSLLLEN